MINRRAVYLRFRFDKHRAVFISLGLRCSRNGLRWPAEFQSEAFSCRRRSTGDYSAVTILFARTECHPADCNRTVFRTRNCKPFCNPFCNPIVRAQALCGALSALFCRRASGDLRCRFAPCARCTHCKHKLCTAQCVVELLEFEITLHNSIVRRFSKLTFGGFQ